jgi:putative restriction endonuclease
MTESEVRRVFEGMNVAQLDGGFALHKPIMALLLLEMIANGHENRFAYKEFDVGLRRLLERYGSPRAAEARAEPFWRLKNDGILDAISPYSLLAAATSTPTPAQLLAENATATMPGDLYQSLRLSPKLISDVAEAIGTRFLQRHVGRSILEDAAPSIALSRRTYWWVSQNSTHQAEVNGDFMWSPKTSVNGRRNPNYEFMRQVVPGDVIFSFWDSKIMAIGIAKQSAVSSPKPTTFGSRGNHWLNEGWLVEVAFYGLGSAAIRPSDHMDLIAPTLPSIYSPIRPSGAGNQMYLAPVPREMASVLLSLIGPSSNVILDNVNAVLKSEWIDEVEDAALEQIMARSDIGETEKQQLVLARRGQGLFRTGLYQVEPRCRITHVTNKVHLVASHIKPWSKSDNEERLDRFNGLLLAPHADHLFDGGYISFANNGNLIVSRKLDPSILIDWHIDPTINVGAFRREQSSYLEYHRDAILIR